MKSLILFASLSLVISCSKQGPVAGDHPTMPEKNRSAAPQFVFDRQEKLLIAGRLRQSTIMLGHPDKADTFVAVAAIPVLSANENFENALDSKRLSSPGKLVAAEGVDPEILKVCVPGDAAIARASDLRDMWYVTLTMSGKKADCEKLPDELSLKGFDVVFSDAEIQPGDKRKEVRLKVFPVRQQSGVYADSTTDLNKDGLTATGEITSLPVALPKPAASPTAPDMVVVGVNNLSLAEGISSLRWDSANEVTLGSTPAECKIKGVRLLPLYGGQEATMLILLESGALKNSACLTALDTVFSSPLKISFRKLNAAVKKNDPMGNPVLVDQAVKEASLQLKPRVKQSQPLPAPDSNPQAAYSLENGKTGKGLLPTSCNTQKDPDGKVYLVADFATAPKQSMNFALPDAATSVAGRPPQVHASDPSWLNVETGEIMVKKVATEKDLAVRYSLHELGFVFPVRPFCRVFYYLTPSKKLVGRFDCQSLGRFDPNGTSAQVDGNGTFSCQLP